MFFKVVDQGSLYIYFASGIESLFGGSTWNCNL